MTADRVVVCPNCAAPVALTDTECWRCGRYFGATTFEDQLWAQKPT